MTVAAWVQAGLALACAAPCIASEAVVSGGFTAVAQATDDATLDNAYTGSLDLEIELPRSSRTQTSADEYLEQQDGGASTRSNIAALRLCGRCQL